MTVVTGGKNNDFVTAFEGARDVIKAGGTAVVTGGDIRTAFFVQSVQSVP